jgi:hypothetical protein
MDNGQKTSLMARESKDGLTAQFTLVSSAKERDMEMAASCTKNLSQCTKVGGKTTKWSK